MLIRDRHGDVTTIEGKAIAAAAALKIARAAEALTDIEDASFVERVL